MSKNQFRIANHLFSRGPVSTFNMDVYNYADKLLECLIAKPITADQLKINENSFDCVYNLLTENECFPSYEDLNLFPDKKSDELAWHYRMKGNEMFKAGKFSSALCSYNKSLCYAEQNSNSLGLAFANRSAVYLEIDEPELCRQNIQWAKDFNYPKNKLAKLKRREKLCRKVKTRKSNERNLLQLSYKPSPKFPFVIDALKLKCDDRFGRHIITEQNLIAGDVIVIERPFVALALPKCIFKRCTNCLEQFTMNLIPCLSCTSAMFCSRSCMDKANEKFHRFECDFSCHAFVSFFTIAATSALRTFLKAVHTFRGCVEELESYLREHNGLDITAADIDIYEESYERKLFMAVNSLCTNEHRRHAVEKFRRMIACVIMSDFLAKHSKLNELLRTDSSIKFFVNFMYRHIQIAESNYHELYALSTEKKIQVNEQFGVGSFPFSSLLNHSCAPNVIRLTFDTCNYIIVSRNIAKGKQIFDNYGFHHSHHNLQNRAHGLMERYQFSCNCEACANNFPLFEDLPETDENFDKFVSDDIEDLENFTLQEAKASITKFSRYLSNHEANYPCYEAVLVQECLLRCFRAFEKNYSNVNEKIMEN